MLNKDVHFTSQDENRTKLVWKIFLESILVIFTVLIFRSLLHWNTVKRCWCSCLYRTPEFSRYLLMLYLRKWNALEWVVMTINGATSTNQVEKLRIRCDVYLTSIVSNLYLLFLTWKRLKKTIAVLGNDHKFFSKNLHSKLTCFMQVFLSLKM